MNPECVTWLLKVSDKRRHEVFYNHGVRLIFRDLRADRVNSQSSGVNTHWISCLRCCRNADLDGHAASSDEGESIRDLLGQTSRWEGQILDRHD